MVTTTRLCFVAQLGFDVKFFRLFKEVHTIINGVDAELPDVTPYRASQTQREWMYEIIKHANVNGWERVLLDGRRLIYFKDRGKEIVLITNMYSIDYHGEAVACAMAFVECCGKGSIILNRVKVES